MLQDEDYETSGAKIVNTKEAFGQDIILKVRPPKIDPEAGQFKDGARYFQHTIGQPLLVQYAMQSLAVLACNFWMHTNTMTGPSQHLSCIQASQLCLPWTQQRATGRAAEEEDDSSRYSCTSSAR